MFLLLGTNNHFNKQNQESQIATLWQQPPMSPSLTPVGYLLTKAVWLPSLHFLSLYIHFSPVAAPEGERKRTFPVSLSSATLNFRAFVHRVQLLLKVALSSRLHSPPPPLPLCFFHPPLYSLWINTGNFLPQPISALV